MNYQQITSIVVIAVIVILVCYDLVIVALGGSPATISRVVLNAAHDYPVIPFAAGVLCGHLFWAQVLK